MFSFFIVTTNGAIDSRHCNPLKRLILVGQIPGAHIQKNKHLLRPASMAIESNETTLGTVFEPGQRESPLRWCTKDWSVPQVGRRFVAGLMALLVGGWATAAAGPVDPSK